MSAVEETDCLKGETASRRALFYDVQRCDSGNSWTYNGATAATRASPHDPRAIAFKFALAPQISVLNRNDALIRPNISQLAHTNPQP